MNEMLEVLRAVKKAKDRTVVQKEENFFENDQTVSFNKIQIAGTNTHYSLYPVDAWNSKNWKSFFRDLYQDVFGSKFPYNQRDFNFEYNHIISEGREEHGLTNEEIQEFFYWLSNTYLSYLRDNNRTLNIKRVHFKIPDFYQRIIVPRIKLGGNLGRDIRGVIFDSHDMNESISEQILESPDHLIRQIGIPNVIFYLIKQRGISSQDAFVFVYESIDQRLKFERTMLNPGSFFESLVKNSIYWGPYPFNEQLESMGIPKWRDVLREKIKSEGLDQQAWWSEDDPCRESLPCLKQLMKVKKKV